VPPQIATVIFAVGIAGLFWLDRDDSVRPSRALWLPVIWLWSNGSRPPSGWLGINMTEIAGQLPPSSPIDQFLAASLILLGVAVLCRRRDWGALLRASWPIVVYFSFSLASLAFSDYPAWGLKRWVRALGDVIMVLIVVTDAQPAAALRRLISRVGFVLLPASVLLIRYYPQLGRGFDPFGGDAIVNTGVTTNKNVLGLLTYLVTLGTLWQVLVLWRDKTQPSRTRRLVAQGALLWFGISLLFTAHSATSGACFVLGAALMLVTTLPFFRARTGVVHALVLAILIGGSLSLLFGGNSAITGAVGRKSDFSGRTEVWAVVIPMVPNPIVGAGFETFWVGPRVREVFVTHGGYTMTNEAHNGYIEVYLNLGWIGVGLIALILGQGYRTAVRAFRRESELGALLVAYVVTLMLYNITEAGFRMLSLSLFFLFLSIVSACRINRLAKTAPESDGEFDRHLANNSDVLEFDDWKVTGDLRPVE